MNTIHDIKTLNTKDYTETNETNGQSVMIWDGHLHATLVTNDGSLEKQDIMESYFEDIDIYSRGHLESDNDDFGHLLEDFCQKQGYGESKCEQIRQFVHRSSYLHFAIKYFDEDFLKLLLRSNADLNKRGYNDEYPFEENTDSDQRKRVYKILCQHFHYKVFEFDANIAKFVNKVEICFTRFEDTGTIPKLAVLVHISRETGITHCSCIEKLNNVKVEFVFNDDVSLEAKTAQMHERLEQLQSTVLVDRNIGKDLFDKHSNLNAIRPSPLRSKGYGTRNHRLIQQSCIVLYCRKKGYIPINEERFPSEINGIRTDVREGYFMFGANKIRHGDEIYRSSKTGTLGGLIEFPDGSFGFITCSHVLFETEELKQLRTKGFQEDMLSTVYKQDIFTSVGNVIDAKFITDIENTCSIDAAVVRINDTFKRFVDPSYPEIHDLKGLPRNPRFTKTESLSNTLSRGTNRVIKFGSTTKFTHGTLQFDTKSHVRLENKDLKIIENFESNNVDKEEDGQMEVEYGYSFTMYNQLCVSPSSDHKFFSAGDSGAFVYLLQDPVKQTYRCLGMAIGEISDGVCVVTDIQNILSSFHIHGLRLIEPETVIDDEYVTKSFLNEKFNSLDAKLDRTLEGILNLGHRVQALEQNKN